MIQVNLIQDQTIQIIFIKHKNIRQLKEKEFLQQTLEIKKFSKMIFKINNYINNL